MSIYSKKNAFCKSRNTGVAGSTEGDWSIVDSIGVDFIEVDCIVETLSKAVVGVVTSLEYQEEEDLERWVEEMYAIRCSSEKRSI